MVPGRLQEDEVPETNDGTPPVAVAETPSQIASKEILADLTEALAGYGNPVPAAGQSKEAKAEAPPASSAVTTKAKEDAAKADAPATEVEPPKERKAPDFKALPDSVRPTFEKLWQDGGDADKAAVEEAVKGHLRQDDYTRKRQKDAEERRVWEASKAEESELLASLKGILADPVASRAFVEAKAALQRKAPEAEPVDIATLTPEEQAKAIDERVSAKMTAAERQAAETAAAEDKAEAGLRGAAASWYDSVKEQLSAKEGEALLQKVQAEWVADGVNPLVAVKPAALTRRLNELAEITLAKKQAAAAEAQLSKRQASEARSAKASSPPGSRVAAPQEYDLRTAAGRLEKSLAELGIEDWSQVPLGNRGPETAI